MLTAARRLAPRGSTPSFVLRLQGCGAQDTEIALLDDALHAPEGYRAGEVLHPPRPNAPPFFMCPDGLAWPGSSTTAAAKSWPSFYPATQWVSTC
jgi:hypothetical protein